MNLTRKIDSLRAYRVGLRKKMDWVKRAVREPADRENRLAELNLALRMTDTEWTALHHQAGRTLPGRPVKAGW